MFRSVAAFRLSLAFFANLWTVANDKLGTPFAGFREASKARRAARKDLAAVRAEGEAYNAEAGQRWATAARKWRSAALNFLAAGRIPEYRTARQRSRECERCHKRRAVA